MTQGRPYVDYEPRTEVDPDQPAAPRRKPFSGSAGSLQRLRDANLYELADGIAKRHGVPMNQLFTGQRGRSYISACRDEIVTIIRDTRRWSWGAIGDLVGCDHTSVMLAVARHRERVVANQPVGKVLASLDEPVPIPCARCEHCECKAGATGEQVVGVALVSCDPSASRAHSESGSGSSQLTNLSTSFPAAAVSSDARGLLAGHDRAAVGTSVASAMSPNAQLIADRIRQHAELSSLDAAAIADKFEGARMIASKPAVADVLTAIDDYALTVTGQPNAPAALQKGLRTYMQNARPPKPAAALGQPGGGKGQERGSTGIKYKTFAVEKADGEDYVAPPSSAELAKRAEALLAQLGPK